MPKSSEVHLKLRQIEVFLEAANQGTFLRASSALGVTSATLSQAIRDLEETLGTPLFRRDDRGRGARLTVQGEALIGPASRMLAAAREAREAVARTRLKPTRLVVAYQPMLAGTARAALEAFLRGHPSVRVQAIEEPLATLPRLFQNRANNHLEVALAYLPGERAEPDVVERFRDLEAEPLSASGLWLVTSPLRPVRQEQGSVNLDALKNEPFALVWLPKGRRSFMVREAIRQYFKENDFRPRPIVFRSNRVSAVLAVVRAGLAVTVLPTIDPRERETLILHALRPAPASWHAVGLLWPRDAVRSPAAEAFANEVRKRLGPTTSSRT